MSLKRKPFYGWIIVVFGVLVMGVTHGVVTNCFSHYILPATAELGVSREAFSLCLTTVNLLYTLISFLSGRIYRKVKINTAMRVASITLPVFFACYSFCHTMIAFYLCSIAVGISVSFLSFLPFTQIISNWFEEKRGRAIGICFMGSGLGGMVMSALTALFIDRFGWRMSYRLTGVIMLLVLVPVCFLVLKDKPEEMGLRPLGVQDGKNTLPVYGIETRKAVRTPSFIAVAILAMVIGFVSTVIGGATLTRLVDVGYSTLYASGVVSVYLGLLAAGKILLGSMYDKIGAKKGTLVAMIGLVMAFVGLYFADIQWMHIIFLIGAAIGVAASNVSYPVLTKYAFGTRDYDVLYGIVMGSNFFTCCFGLVVANMIYSATGSYNTAIILCGALCVLGIGALTLIRPCARNQKT